MIGVGALTFVIPDRLEDYVDMVMGANYDKLNTEVEGMEEDPNLSALKFYNLSTDVDEPLWDGCKKHMKLSALTQLINLKSV
ncbi:hypothetical protein Fmac_014925 [Flemingia macrophylla]|uniref:Uncharacterized protein n=1 Tax=Flemingia macrophylla TaxID=520843 RepID=A0ABD1MD83_9FABA